MACEASQFTSSGSATFSPPSDAEKGINASEDKVRVHYFLATVLHLLGIDHERLAYKFQGRHYRLTDVHGNVVKPVLAWERGRPARSEGRTARSPTLNR